MSEYVSVDYEDYSNKAIKFYVFLKIKINYFKLIFMHQNRFYKIIKFLFG